MIEIPVDGAYDEAEAERAGLVGMRLSGSRPPLLLVRTWSGELAHERVLSRHLGDDQPIYSVAPPSGAQVADFPADANAWADLALARLRDVPYSGPALLGGWSFGGVVAHEVALRLARAGREVGLLALLDTRLPVQRSRRRRGRTRRGAFHKSVRSLDRFLEHRSLAQRLAYLRGRARRRQEKLATRMRRVNEWRRRSAGAHALPEPSAREDADFVTPTGRRITLLQRAIWVCYRKYRPTASALPVVQLRTAESQEASGDASLGWAPWLLGDFETVLIPGRHFTMFEEPGVQVLALRLASALARATEKRELGLRREPDPLRG